MSSQRGQAVAVVTDSTAALLPGPAHEAGVVVVPLHVHVGETTTLEGAGADEATTAVLRGDRVTTSQPTPEVFAERYAELAAAGAREIVSVHLSGELSGTVHAAALAAHRAPVPVRVVDSRVVGMGLGFAVLAAARGATSGASAADVEGVALETARSASGFFLVDSLEHLRRGGRLSLAASAVGTALGMKPLLTLRDGRVAVLAKVRTRAAAVARLTALVEEEAVRCARPRVALHYLGDGADVRAIAADLVERTGLEVIRWRGDEHDVDARTDPAQCWDRSCGCPGDPPRLRA
jgi:DegV family protein with EDD domain